jgi:predicted nucleotidyltransferase
MLRKDNRYKILRVFFDNPNPKGVGFQLREISRKVNIAPPSVKKYLDELSKEEGYGYPLIIKGEHRVHRYPVYMANRASEYFRFLKKIDMITRLYESRILQYLYEKCIPGAIVLFGSASKGEDLEDSDVDLFLLCKERKLDIGRYEDCLKRRISVLFEENFNKLSKELKNNILNGVILQGYLKVF